MPRIRTIKPSFFKSEDVAALPLSARLTWIGLWTHCDDAGRAKDNVRLIKAEVWPLDDHSLAEVEKDLMTLAEHGRIVRYEVDGKRYLEITNWSDHQSIARPTPSKIPPPPSGLHESSVSPHGTDMDGSPLEGKGKEGKGRDAHARPPDRCPQHREHPDPPACGKCKDARLTAERWDRDRLEQRRQDGQRAAQLRADCPDCDADGWLLWEGQPVEPLVKCVHPSLVGVS